jgi:hypothetical protein
LIGLCQVLDDQSLTGAEVTDEDPHHQPRGHLLSQGAPRDKLRRKTHQCAVRTHNVTVANDRWSRSIPFYAPLKLNGAHTPYATRFYKK